MKSYFVRASIRATPERFWSLLTDATEYTRWNNTVEKVDGKIALGEAPPRIRNQPVRVVSGIACFSTLTQ